MGKNSQEFKLLFIEDKIENENYHNKAEFVLAIPNLRQWLNALFKIYLKANWDTKFFPGWIDTDMSLSEEKPILNHFIGYAVIEPNIFKHLNKNIINSKDGSGMVKAINLLVSKRLVNVYKYNGLQLTINSVNELREARSKIEKYITFN